MRTGKKNLASVPLMAAASALLALAVACHVDALLGTSGRGGPTGPDSLAQLQNDSATPIPTGGSSPEPSIVLRAALRDSSLAAPIHLEVEIQPVGTAFQGQATAQSEPTPRGGHAYVRVSGLANNTAYHWQGRLVDQGGRTKPWQAYGDNPETAADVRIAVPVATTRLEFTAQGQPRTTTAGATMAAVQVAAVDAQGNRITSFTGTVFVKLAAGPPGATLSGTPSANAVGGVATFSDLSVTTAGSGYRLGANADGFAEATSASFGINADAPDHLVFIQQPNNTTVNRAITPPVKVAVHDHYGNVVISYTGIMYMNIADDGSPLRNARLEPGGTQRSAAAGIATFEDLKIDQVGVGYTIGASTPVTKGGTSTRFDVTP